MSIWSSYGLNMLKASYVFIYLRRLKFLFMSTRRWSFTNTVMSFAFSHPYTINPLYKKRVAYFCMEYAIHQSLKTYAGGLGFLAGSHLKSAYELRQNMVGIGILWKYGYY